MAEAKRRAGPGMISTRTIVLTAEEWRETEFACGVEIPAAGREETHKCLTRIASTLTLRPFRTHSEAKTAEDKVFRAIEDLVRRLQSVDEDQIGFVVLDDEAGRAACVSAAKDLNHLDGQRDTIPGTAKALLADMNAVLGRWRAGEVGIQMPTSLSPDTPIEEPWTDVEDRLVLGLAFAWRVAGHVVSGGNQTRDTPFGMFVGSVLSAATKKEDWPRDRTGKQPFRVPGNTIPRRLTRLRRESPRLDWLKSRRGG